MVRKKLTRSEVARMGGIARADRLSAQERSTIAAQGGNATVAKHGRVHMLRLAFQKAGRL